MDKHNNQDMGLHKGISVTIYIFCLALMSGMVWFYQIPLMLRMGKDPLIFFVLVFAAAEYIILILAKRISIEKRILVSLWVVTFFINMIAILTLEVKIAFQDAIYSAMLLFLGEWHIDEQIEINHLLSVGRFLALFVASGSIVIVLLHQKLRYFLIRSFYKDVVIISDRPEGYITDLAKTLSRKAPFNKKVVIGYTDIIDFSKVNQDGEIPHVYINIYDDKRLIKSLEACNISNAKTVYLLCDLTEKNVQIAKMIYKNYYRTKSEKLAFQMKKDILEAQVQCENKDAGNLKKEIKAIIKKTWGAGNGESKLCYIQYKTDEERNFYSYDPAFNQINREFNTCFINPYDISIRQMIASSKIGSSLSKIIFCDDADVAKHEKITFEKFKSSLEDINILVAGSRQLLRRTFFEISRIAIYNTQLPYTVYYLDYNVCDMSDEAILNNINIGINPEHFKVVPIKPDKVVTELAHIKQFYISSTSEPEIRRIIEKACQTNIVQNTEEIFVTTKGNDSEYGILTNYINAIITQGSLGKECNPAVYISRVTDLIIQFDAFYKQFGPKAIDVFINYMTNTKINANHQFEVASLDKLPELFKDSSLMSVLHTEFIYDLMDSLADCVDFNCGTKECLENQFTEYLSITEHNRWFNERSLQGYVYAEIKNSLLNMNPSMKKWDDLDMEHRELHKRYVMPMLSEGFLTRTRQKYENHLIKCIKSVSYEHAGLKK
ncbi:hypothetical protein KHM83_16445 [Fusibacter paucivorans]|uniref:RCK N-terminal domain-containing protein n=1 Tax=Fusibacter paucivorans TaxID=76009 RepID=A0ABS5PSY6_9FIRM|nr:hypothetical protein [Fusibacter paucivorans]MBS7528280.1 hypothetical protein [Fusibacter paucivorans]